MLRHLTITLSASLVLLLAGSASAINITADSLTVTEYDQGTPLGEQFESEVTTPTGAFTNHDYTLSSPASSGSLTFDASGGGFDVHFLDLPFGADVGSDYTVTLSGGGSASFAINQNVGLVGGLPTITSFNIVATTLTVDWDCTTCVGGVNSTSNFLNVSAFDIATDGDVFDEVANTNNPQGLTGQSVIDLSTAVAGAYALEVEFFSKDSLVDPFTDPGNTWSVSTGRSALNGGYGFTLTPEPGTGVLVGLGLVGLVATRRSRG